MGRTGTKLLAGLGALAALASAGSAAADTAEPVDTRVAAPIVSMATFLPFEGAKMVRFILPSQCVVQARPVDIPPPKPHKGLGLAFDF